MTATTNSRGAEPSTRSHQDRRRFSISRCRQGWIFCILSATTLIAAACGSGSGSSDGDSDADTLVVDTYFILKTIDPGREFEDTGHFVVKTMYDSLLTFEGSDVTTPKPNLANYELSPDSKELTLTMTPGRVFSDGSPVTADDVVFSLNRLVGMKGNASYLLAGVTVTKKDDETVVLTTDVPMPQLPSVLTAPATSILNSKLVQEKGGSTDETDDAEDFLNSQSAGSGPYVLDTLDMSSEVRLVRNEKYNGPDEPAYEHIVIRNVQPATQKLNVQQGDADVALSLSGDQVRGLEDKLNVVSSPSANTVFLLLNQSPAVSSVTSNPDFVTAVKKAIDHEALLEVAGVGAVRAAGVVPPLFSGALDSSDGLTYDLEGAKEAFASSGMAGEPVKLSYPSDLSISGLNLQSIAERVQSQLAAAGIEVTLAPAPVATEVDSYRNGKEEMGLWNWSADFPDAASYLAFGPGALVGLRANWDASAAPEVAELAETAAAGGEPDERAAIYNEYQVALNESGPFVPLLHPSSNIVTAKGVTGAAFNPMWTVNVAELAPR